MSGWGSDGWRWAAALALLVGAVLVARLPLTLLAGPELTEEHQLPLAEWQARLSEALADVPPDVAVGYLPPGGYAESFEPDTPSLTEARGEFERVQAALAPRRILATTEAEVVLVHVSSLRLLAQTEGFAQLGELVPVKAQWVLARRGAR
jgi:hypothetical protein